MIEKWQATATRPAREFLFRYSQQLITLPETVRMAEGLIKSIIKPANLAIHQVSARPKSLDSMRLKLRRKCYRKPETQIRDSIGIRIITYYADDVDRVTELLKLEFQIDEANSEDKRRVLENDAFGYRSVHVIACLKGSRLGSPEYTALRGQWFEIQIRSLLEHAWAEIEHEVKYKPRIDYPSDFIRRFARIAGMLEILDTEFLALRNERDKLIESYREAYNGGRDQDVTFDSARLLGFLEAVRSEGLSWRKAGLDGKPFPPHIEASCVDALITLKIDTPRRMRKALSDRRFKAQLRRFAQIANVAPVEVSHLALVLLLVLTFAPSRLMDLFPVEACDSTEFREMRRSE